MKGKIMMVLVLVALVVTTGCEVFTVGFWTPFIDLPDMGFQSVDEARVWVDENVAYVSDDDRYGGEYWQSPYETYELRQGDCDDMAILLMYLLTEQLGVSTEMKAGFSDTEGHAWVGRTGQNVWYEPQKPGIDNVYDAYMDRFDTIYTIDYDEALRRSHTVHRSVSE